MPLPDEAVTLTGGCSCGAIRYRVSIPAVPARNLPNPFAHNMKHFSLGQVVLCHCNDCRRSTSSLLPVPVLQIPGTWLTVSVLPRDPTGDKNNNNSSSTNINFVRFLDVLAPDYNKATADANRPEYLPATQVLRATNPVEGESTWLRFFHSVKANETFSRPFCGRCGAQVSFHLGMQPDWCDGGKLPEGYSDIFDIWVGSLDREFLTKDWLFPAIEIFFSCGTLLGRTVSATAKHLKDLPKTQNIFDDLVTEEELEGLR